jgi:soluble lytic murein transglycosylase-like protein
MVANAASTFALPEAWLNAVMARESGGKTVHNGRPITSAAGAMGLMQVVPSTYDDLRKQLGLGADPYAPADDITIGAAYLQQMYRRYSYPGMFVA